MAQSRAKIPPPEVMAERLRALTRSAPPDLAVAVEACLEDAYREVPLLDRLVVLEEVTRRIERRGERAMAVPAQDVARLMTLLLGREVAQRDLSAQELTEKVAASLKTVFDTVNRLLGVIHSTLLGEADPQETIRQVIGERLEAEDDDCTLEKYLEQIQQAFLVSQQAFQQACRKVTGDMLAALDPEALAASLRVQSKFGVRRGEVYDAYRDRFQQCRKWFDSELFAEELLREFERVCQRMLKVK